MGITTSFADDGSWTVSAGFLPFADLKSAITRGYWTVETFFGTEVGVRHDVTLGDIGYTHVKGLGLMQFKHASVVKTRRDGYRFEARHDSQSITSANDAVFPAPAGSSSGLFTIPVETKQLELTALSSFVFTVCAGYETPCPVIDTNCIQSATLQFASAAATINPNVSVGFEKLVPTVFADPSPPIGDAVYITNWTDLFSPLCQANAMTVFVYWRGFVKPESVVSRFGVVLYDVQGLIAYRVGVQAPNGAGLWSERVYSMPVAEESDFEIRRCTKRDCWLDGPIRGGAQLLASTSLGGQLFFPLGGLPIQHNTSIYVTVTAMNGTGLMTTVETKNSDLLAVWADAFADWESGLAGFSYAPDLKAGLARTVISEPIDQSLPALPKFSLQLLDRNTGATVHGQSPTAYLDSPIITLRVAGAESFSYGHLIEVGIINASLDPDFPRPNKCFAKKRPCALGIDSFLICQIGLCQSHEFRAPCQRHGTLDPHVAKGNVNVSESAILVTIMPSVNMDATVPLNCSLGIFSSIALSTYDAYGPSPLSPLPTAANTVVHPSISLGAASTAGVNLTAVVTAINPAGLKTVVQRL
ncbi:hypothetical protein BDZ88DRAFT_454542 [Geranomyces variabilis]|nr:hypothetical protein BDZ88DRAFT_454542 [Geranomyces variabilis]KAJ3134314.1 hypothetical protein HDU90_005180 [Geranomyces variabilis]